MRHIARILLLAAVMEPVCAECSEPSDGHLETRKVQVRRYESGGWTIIQTSNFRFCTRNADVEMDDLPELCEPLRQQIRQIWLEEGGEQWVPRCDVILHATLTEYQRALGAGVGRSVGCATTKADGGRIVSRRIDIRTDADAWQKDALPHELTHVVLADRFPGRRLPPWADEGIGVLSESKRKQQIRAEAFRVKARGGYLYSAAEVMSVTKFPPRGYRESFYAQSAALVRGLASRGRPSDFVRFVDESMNRGWRTALNRVYDIDDPRELRAVSDPSYVTKSLASSWLDDAMETAAADRPKKMVEDR